MTEGTILALLLLALGWALVSRRTARFGLTGPAVFLAAGALLGQLGVIEVNIDSATVRLLIEVTLGLSLFSDASTVQFRQLRGETSWPLRMLLPGLRAERHRPRPSPSAPRRCSLGSTSHRGGSPCSATQRESCSWSPPA